MMEKDNIKQKAVNGIIWSAIQKYSTIIVSFLSGIILSRLLTPEDFGCIGMLAIFMALADTFIDGGFGAALIQKKAPTQVDYSTVFYFNMAMSIFLYSILFFCAPLISSFYNMPILCNILRVQGIVLLISALNVIHRNQIRKNLQFKKLAKIQVFTSILTFIITVILAYTGYGVWALVVQNIMAALIPCIIFWISSTWHPSYCFSKQSFKELFGFGSYMLLGHIFNNIGDKISGLLIGRWFDSSTMGYFSRAQQTEQLASSSISSILIQTTYPLYSAVQDDHEHLRTILKRISSTLAYITFPLLFLLIIVAKPLFILLFSERWLPSVPYFQLLCFSGMASCLQGVNHQIIAAIGKSRIQFNWIIVKRVCSILMQVGGLLFYGMNGLMIGMVISSWFSYYINIVLVSKYINYNVLNQIKELLPIIGISMFSAIFSLTIQYYIKMSYISELFICTLVFIIIYIGVSFLFKLEAFSYFLSIIKTFIIKK